MVSVGPNPYAPGKPTADEPLVSRPAGRVGVFLWAVFVIALSEPEFLWNPFPRELFEGEKTWGQNFFVFASIPVFLTPVWAYLSDRVPVMATRREGHLLLAAVLSAGAWAAALFLPHAYGPWLIVSLVLGVGTRVATTATQGALVEIGQRIGRTGLLAASLIGLRLLATVVTWPVADVLRQRPFGWTAMLGAFLAISIVVVVGMFSDQEQGTSDPITDSQPRDPLWKYLRSSTLWWVLAIVALAGLGTSAPLMMKVRRASALSDDMWSNLERLTLAASLVSALVYAVLSGRMNGRKLAILSFLLATLGTLSLYALDQDPGSLVLGLVLATRALGIGFANVAVVDLAFRAAPRGREALGYVLIVGARYIVVVPATALLIRCNLPTLISVGAALFALAAVSTTRSPKTLFASRIQEPKNIPAMSTP